MRRPPVSLVALVLLLSSCFGGNANLTESGEGKPLVSIDVPETVDAGSRATATLTIENPGPGDMEHLLVTFAVLGAPDVPDALVGFGAEGRNPSVISVEPEPTAVSEDGVIYRFDGLEEGESTTIEFTLRVPPRPGRYANSVSVSDGTDLERASGVPLKVEVEG